MGFRFRKSVKIAPGIRLNLSRSGISTSFGRPGATVNVGRGKTRATVGIPGSGLSYSTLLGRSRVAPLGNAQAGRGAGSWLVVGLVVIAVLLWASGGSQRAPAAAMQPAPLAAAVTPAEPAQTVTARANCRATPSADAAIVRRLAIGEHIVPARRQGGWAEVRANGATCWVSTSLLSNAAPHAAVPARHSASLDQLVAATPRRSRQSRPASTRSRAAGGGACPCSGRNVCVGPRGGRYCITSGGNKRYGV